MMQAVREAVDVLCEHLDHEDVARALGVSVQTVRQGRLKPGAKTFRTPTRDWEKAIIRLAEDRVWHYRRLIDRVRGKE
jgi:hypothetical protein